MTLVVSGAFAQTPPAPSNLTAQPNPGAPGVLLQWDGSQGAHGYKVYKSVDSSTHFMRIGMTQQTQFVDWMAMPGHTYRYHVTAFNIFGESPPSNVVAYTPFPPVTGTIAGIINDDSTGLPIHGARVVFFVNPLSGMPVRVVFTDSLGQYSANLSVGSYFVYASKYGYRGEWYDNSPTLEGAAPIAVAHDSTSIANFGLSPYALPPPRITGTLTGVVTDDSTSAPIAGVRIRLFRLTGFRWSPEARTDSLGVYSIVVDTGIYLVYATKFGYVPEWYDNSPTRDGATPVVITEGGTSTANFGLSRLQPPRYVSVSGRVIDSTTGNPIARAAVAILRTPRELNVIQDLNGTPGGLREETVSLPGLGMMHGVVWWGRTDSSGNYTGHVIAGHTYIAYSVAEGYIGEWFDNRRSPTEADRLTLNNDTTGIDFDLVPNPLVQNSIAGAVVDSFDVGVRSHVVLFFSTSRGPYPVRWVMTDSGGNYMFRYVRAGTYYLKAFPVADYAPAWYKAGAYGIRDWRQADTVVANGAVTGIDIGVVPISAGGFALISGRVVDDQNRSISGAVVYAVSTTSSRIEGHDITESSGEFRLEHLAPGGYRVVVDREGYVDNGSPVVDLNLTNNYEVRNAVVRVTPVSPTWGGEPDGVPTRYALEQNYPNPFNPSTEIRLSVPLASSVSLVVYNVLGQEVTTLFSGRVDAGTYAMTWEGRDRSGAAVASGLYFYRIMASPENGQGGQFRQVRKMLMLK